MFYFLFIDLLFLFYFLNPVVYNYILDIFSSIFLDFIIIVSYIYLVFGPLCKPLLVMHGAS